MAFLISEYKDKKQEIIDNFPKKYSGIDPKLFKILQNQVLLQMWRNQKKLENDGLTHCGIELNVVGENKLVPFEIEKPEAFKVKELENDNYLKGKLNKQKSKYFSQNSKQLKEMKKSGQDISMLVIRKYLPNLERNSSQVSKHGNDGAFNISFKINEGVVIELVGKGFDDKDITRKNIAHERYIIPWNDIVFMRNKKDLVKNRNVLKYIINDNQYSKTRRTKIELLPKDKLETESKIPSSYTPINDDIISTLLDKVVFQFYSKKSDLVADGLTNFSIQGNIVKDEIIPSNFFTPEKWISDTENER